MSNSTFVNLIGNFLSEEPMHVPTESLTTELIRTFVGGQVLMMGKGSFYPVWAQIMRASVENKRLKLEFAWAAKQVGSRWMSEPGFLDHSRPLTSKWLTVYQRAPNELGNNDDLCLIDPSHVDELRFYRPDNPHRLNPAEVQGLLVSAKT